MPSGTIAIASNFTAEPVADSLQFWLHEFALPLDVDFAPFDQVFQQLLDPSSLLGRNASGANAVLLKLDAWLHADDRRGISAAQQLDRNVDELIAALGSAAQRGGAPYVVVICPPAPDVLADPLRGPALAASEGALRAAFAANAGVHVVTPRDVAAVYPVASYYDAAGEELGDVPYTAEYFAALGTTLARKIRAAVQPPYKVLVLDCDNTLWRGVVGELGPAGVQVDDSMRALQAFVVEQHHAGMLVCLASKNNEADVREVFATRSDMVLRWEHILLHRINWGAKSANLRSMAEELNLGMDSFVFVDDSPYEIAEVRANAPAVLALQLPDAPADVLRFPHHAWAFDRLGVTEADRKRAASYRDNAQRDAALKESGDLADFLRSLELVVDITVPADAHLARASQMTQRTNQFNFTTIRRTEPEMRRLVADGPLQCRIVSVRDRFGDYGVVGLMIFEVRDAALRVDSLLLSCRALGRGVEHRMLTELGAIAQAAGAGMIELPLVRTAKNTPALQFLTGLGVTPEADGDRQLFRLTVQAARDAQSAALAQAAVAAPRDENDAAPTAARDGSSASELMTRIVSELDSAPRILAAIHARKVRAHARPPRVVIAPRTDTERVIVATWKEALHVDEVSVTDGFFDLGGTSLASIPVFARLRKDLGTRLTPLALIQAPTVELLAALIDGSGAHAPAMEGQRATSLVPFQAGGSNPPLFCMHAGAGTILFYSPLARALGPDQPFYGLQAQGVDGRSTPQATVEEMAALYIAEMRTVQPAGPYHVAGFCFGAIVAYEVAQQLRQQGEEVALIASLDGPAPGFNAQSGRAGANDAPPQQGMVASAVQRARDWWDGWFGTRRNRFLVRRSQSKGGPVPPFLRRFAWYFHVNNLVARVNYKPKPYAGDLAVITIKNRYSEPRLGWARLVQGTVTPYEIAGDFRSHRDLMYEPMVSRVADTLRPFLQQTPGHEHLRAAR